MQDFLSISLSESWSKDFGNSVSDMLFWIKACLLVKFFRSLLMSIEENKCDR
jgi:hypothetical protein